MIKLAISGAKGRMGQAIVNLALKQPDQFKISALLEREGHPEIGSPINGLAVSFDNSNIKGCDALIEFTLPEGTINNLNACVEHNVAMVIGTTGFTANQTELIKTASKKIPIVFSSNMSIGVNILFKLIEITSKKIGADKISISETHHVHKKDAPSGTAKTMAEYAEKFSSLKVEPIEAFREGEVIGDHQITFDTPEDILTIYHHAKDRSMFAKGALQAAVFLKNKKPGLFNMQDVLGLTLIQ